MNEHSFAHSICVIVPILNEQENLPKLLTQFGHFSFEQVIFVDGGSSDDSWPFLQELQKTQAAKSVNGITQFLAIQSEPGRAKQMNAGASKAKNKTLLFLHADSLIADDCRKEIDKGLEKNAWGRFDIRFQEHDWRMIIIAWFMNWRSRITGISTGDQAIFIRREFFDKLNGFADISLMEDVEFCKRALKLEKPYCSQSKVATSARRWLKNGVIKTVFLMWGFRLAYFLGANPNKLAARYRQIR